MGYSPVMLNRLVPELTRHMTAKIFATDLEDWPAMLRAMRETGEDLRQGKIASFPPPTDTALRLRINPRPCREGNYTIGETDDEEIFLASLFACGLPSPAEDVGASAQDDASRIRVSVVLVQLNVAVTDNKGNYVSGLGPEDFAITEDKIPEKTRDLRRRKRPHPQHPRASRTPIATP